MIGQDLDVVALYDSDKDGDLAKDKLVKNWLTRYRGRHATALGLGPVCGVDNREFAIEDIFPEQFYLRYVQQVYEKALAAAGVTTPTLRPGGQIVTRLHHFFVEHDLKFNKGTVAKPIRNAIREMTSIDQLPSETVERAKSIIKAITDALPINAPNNAAESPQETRPT